MYWGNFFLWQFYFDRETLCLSYDNTIACLYLSISISGGNLFTGKCIWTWVFSVCLAIINVREHRRANKNGQSKETGKIWYTRPRKTKKKRNTRTLSLFCILQYLWPVVTLFTGKSLLTLLFCVGLIHNTSFLFYLRELINDQSICRLVGKIKSRPTVYYLDITGTYLQNVYVTKTVTRFCVWIKFPY